MKKTVSILLILSTLLLTLAACSDKGADSTTGTTAATSEPDPFDLLADTDPVYGSQYVYDDYSPYITTDDLSVIAVDKAAADELVEDSMIQVLKRYQGISFVDAPEDAVVADRDRATIYYVGYSADPDFTIDESTLAGMTNKTDDEGYGLIIGSGSFIPAYESEEHPENNNPGFEEQLIGVKAGETVTITVTFPDGYSYAPELGGVQIKFDVTVEKIENPDPEEPTELTDALVEDYTGGDYTTVEGLREYLLNYYKAQLAYDVVRQMIRVTNYPEDEYNELFKSYMDTYVDEDTSEEELAALRESGDKAVKDYIADNLVLNFLFAHFDIKLTKGVYLEKLQAYYDANAMMYAIYYGITSPEALESFMSRDSMISEFKAELLIDALAEAAVWAE